MKKVELLFRYGSIKLFEESYKDGRPSKYILYRNNIRFDFSDRKKACRKYGEYVDKMVGTYPGVDDQEGRLVL